MINRCLRFLIVTEVTPSIVYSVDQVNILFNFIQFIHLQSSNSIVDLTLRLINILRIDGILKPTFKSALKLREEK